MGRNMFGRFTVKGTIGPVVIFDQRLYSQPGLVARWMDQVINQFGVQAKLKAPIRTGALKAGITVSSRRVGTRQVQAVLESAAPHSLNVLRGTTGPIMSNKGWASYMSTGEIPGKGRQMQFIGSDGATYYRGVVSGQRANNFLHRAWKATAQKHRALSVLTVPEVISGTAHPPGTIIIHGPADTGG